MKAKALAIVAVGLLLTACGSSSSSSSSTSTSTPAVSSTANAATTSGSQSTPSASSSSPAKAGASFAVGQTVTVGFAPLSSFTKVTSTLKVTVESIQQGTLADFNGIQLNAQEKAGTPDYVKVTVTNMGPGKVKTADAGADIQGVDSTGQTQQSVTFIGDFPKCNDVSSDSQLAAGQTMHTCLTFLVPGGIKKVGYTGTQDYIDTPVTWSAK